jgi:hypothetical protein
MRPVISGPSLSPFDSSLKSPVPLSRQSTLITETHAARMVSDLEDLLTGPEKDRFIWNSTIISAYVYLPRFAVAHPR